MHLVMFETSGNQHYIFNTNKLRENVGASQLTYQAGTKFVLEAVEESGGPGQLWETNSARLRQNLASTGNPPIESGQHPVEVLLATSGKALLLARDLTTAQKIVRGAAAKALELAPGLDLCGVISEDFSWERVPLHEVIRAVHTDFESVHALMPSPQERFQLLPIVELCPVSGLPAEDFVTEGDRSVPRSRVSLKKYYAAPTGIQRIKAIVGKLGTQLEENIDKLQKQYEELDWLAVVHGDGNGVGQVLLDFHNHIGLKEPAENREYLRMYRAFSLALEESTEQAFVKALEKLPQHATKRGSRVPLVPLVLGGDDITVVCDGEAAIPFTLAFLRHFEMETGDSKRLGGIIPQVAHKALGRGNLSACAGVSVTKPHFPFHSSYHLAKQLLASAKIVKKEIQRQAGPYPCSALDFHVLYDSSAAEIAEIRDRLRTDGGETSLTAKPYVVSILDQATVAQEAVTGKEWFSAHEIGGLAGRIKAIRMPDETTGRRVLPGSQLHDLREGLFLGHDGADGRMKRIRHRYRKEIFDEMLEDKSGDNPSLFRGVSPSGPAAPASTGKLKPIVRETRFLDAMEASDFWNGE